MPEKYAVQGLQRAPLAGARYREEARKATAPYVVGRTSQGKSVEIVKRQVQDPCQLPQYEYDNNPLWGMDCADIDKSKIFGTLSEPITPLSPTDPNYNPNNNPSYRHATCEKIACDTGKHTRRISGPYMGYPDDRCCVANPPYSWTQSGVNFYRIPTFQRTSNIYDGINNTYAYDLIGCNPNSQVYEIPPPRINIANVGSDCLAGQTNATIARDIQYRVGLFNGSSTTATPTKVINVLPTINPAPTINPISSTTKFPSVTTTLTSLASGATLATLAGTNGTMVTGTMAGTGATVTGLAVGLSALGALVVIVGSAYAGYKVVQWWCKAPPRQYLDFNSFESLTVLEEEEVINNPFAPPRYEDVAEEDHIYETIDESESTDLPMSMFLPHEDNVYEQPKKGMK
jgi:hypothetical protein